VKGTKILKISCLVCILAGAVSAQANLITNVASFTAAGSPTTLVFLNADPANDNSNGLDNISLVAGTAAVPEPSVLPFLGAGLFGFALVRRRLNSVKQLRG
jgi:hypothetical protein